MTTPTSPITTDRVTVNGTTLEVATAGEGPAMLLVHGWPHTWRVWAEVIPALAAAHRVIAPDLRGIGGSDRPHDGYDATTLAGDLEGLLDALDAAEATVVAIDAGVPPAFLLALRRPARVTELVLMESLLGGLPGAEAFLAGGPPWWFGFHAVPGLAETVLEGHEAQYLDFFWRSGTRGRGVPAEIRNAWLDAYRGREGLRGGFEHYRAIAAGGRQIAGATAGAGAGARLTVPTLAIGAAPVGAALHGQLAGVADDLCGVQIEDCGHIIPLDRPAELVAAIGRWMAGRTARSA